jgi:CHAT domain-containing protein
MSYIENHMKQCLTLTLLVILSIKSFAQITIDTATTNKMKVAISHFVQKGHLDSAELLIPQCFQIYEQSTTHMDSIEWEIMLSRVGDYFRKNGYPLQALNYYEDAYSISKKLYYEKKIRLGLILYNIGVCNLEKGFYDESIAAFEAASHIFKQEKGENDRYVAFSYISIANGYLELLDYQKALTFYRKALSIYKTQYDNAGIEKPKSVSISEGRIYNNLGTLYFEIGQIEQAIDYYEDALAIYRNHEGEEILQSLSHTFFNLTRAYIELKDYPKAYGYLAVVKDYREQVLNYPIDLGKTYDLFSQYHEHINEIEEAKMYSRKAIDIFEKVFGSKHPLLMDAHTQQGNVFLKNDEIDSAIIAYNHALNSSLAIEFYEPENPKDFEITGLVTLKLFQTFYKKASALERNYHKKKEMKYLEEVVDICHKVDFIAQQLRLSLLQNDQIMLSNHLLDIYQLAVNASFQLYELTKDNKYKEELNYFSEKKKVAALKSIIASVRAKKLSGIPEALLKKERDLASRLNFFNTEIQIIKEDNAPSVNSFKVNSFYDSLFVIRKEYDDLIADFEQNHEKYYQLRHSDEIITSHKVQSLLDEKTIVVSYAFDDKNIYITTITDTSFQIVKQSNTTNIELGEMVFELQNLLQKKTLIQKRYRDKFIELSHKLYQYLIEPIAHQINGQQKLIIIPEGILNYLPFEVLLSSDQEIDFQKMPYLINGFEISYHYSISLYSDFRQKMPYQNTNGMLAVAPIFDDGSESFMANRHHGPLLWSKEEVDYIEKRFKEECPDQKSYILLRGQACESRFKDLVQQEFFDNIHISSHGKANEQTPDLSWIAFFKDEKDSTDISDGYLYASEVYDFQLKTNLLVLSSCESGIGQLSRGEGMTSINRGFLYAGSLNIVYSIWKINDRYTFELMKGFYDNLLLGQNYATALRQSKLDMISQNPIAALPTNWAGFLLIGQ